MATILAIEGDARQAALLKCVVRNHVGATLVVARSTDEAIASIDAGAPDLILLSALLSPREEEEVMAHVRTLERADHLQTLTMPRIAGAQEDEAPRGLLGALRWSRKAKRPAGCDPRQFADEIVQYLQRAEEIRAERAANEDVAEPDAASAERPERVATAVPPPRPAPLAMWAKAESATLAPRQEPVRTLRDETAALIHSLRIPAQLADIGRPHGCRIRRVRVEPEVPTRQHQPDVTRAIA